MFIATTQPNPAPGLFTVQEMIQFHEVLVAEVKASGGLNLTLCVCQHLRGVCSCRKPKSVLFDCIHEYLCSSAWQMACRPRQEARPWVRKCNLVTQLGNEVVSTEGVGEFACDWTSGCGAGFGRVRRTIERPICEDRRSQGQRAPRE